MKHHSEEFALRFTDHKRSVERKFIGGRDFLIDYRAIMRSLLVPLNPRMVDLLRIAAGVYFIDRLVQRDRKHGPESWARNISCSIEVREHTYWTSRPVREMIENAVRFVSGDRWTLDFHPAAHDDCFVCEWQRPIDPTHLGFNRRVCLYSGGLDSAAGLAKRIEDAGEAVTIAVNVQHRTDLGSKVNKQLRLLAKYTQAELHSVIVPFEMNAPKSMKLGEEVSQRARAFLFVATGGVVAGATHSSELEMFESGVGAINVPLVAGVEGSQSTRGTHPTFLKLMSQLLSHVMDQQLNVTLPFMEFTKGEVAKSLGLDKFKEIANSTISCAHYPVRLEKGDSWMSCVLCPACIFRRVALHAAGIEEPSNVYQHDLLDPASSKLDKKKLRFLLAYLVQIDSWSQLDQGQLPLLVTRHLRTTNVLQPGESAQPYLNLFLRYRNEWHRLIEQARGNGCGWASRIDLPGQAA